MNDSSWSVMLDTSITTLLHDKKIRMISSDSDDDGRYHDIHHNDDDHDQKYYITILCL